MPSAFKRGPRIIPTTAPAAAAAAGPSKDATSSSSSSSTSGSSNAAASIAQPPAPAPQTWQSRPATHPTLRPSPFPSQLPLPLFSLGLDSINDVFTGVGLPSASLALFLPHQDGEDEDERTRVGAAQGYADLMCKYAAAQGVAAGQRVLVVGEGVEEWTRGLMGWAGQEGEEKVSRPEPAPSIPAAAPPAEEDKLKVAFRYERLKKIKDEAAEQAASSSSSSGSAQPYVHPFDLSTRISPRVLQKAKQEGRLVVHPLADEVEEKEEQARASSSSAPHSRDSYSEAWEVIQRTVLRWQQESTSDESPLPARIILPSLGSPAWRVTPGRTHAGEAYRLLLRVKTLLRQTAWPSTQPRAEPQPALPIIAISSPSAWLLLGSSGGADVAQRLSSLSDGALSFSSFAADPRTRFLAESPASSTGEGSTSDSSKSSHFTGALRVLRTPAIGSLRGPSIRASALRGMASVSGTGGGGGEGGSSENALGFKVRRKGVKVDVMGRDLVANWGAEEKKEAKTKPTPPQSGETKAAAAVGEASTPPTKRTAGAPSVSVGIEETPVAAAATSSPTPAPAPARGQPQPPARTPLKGLAALRARGLAAQGVDKGEQQPAPSQGGGAAAKQKAVHGANHDW